MQLHKKQIDHINSQRQGWMIIVFGFFGFIVWASTYPIDQGIAGSGFVIPRSEKISITSPASASVVGLLKHSGDHVDAGELLIQLDDLSMKANLQKLQESARGLFNNIRTLEQAHEARERQVYLLKSQLTQSKQVVDAGFVNQQNALRAKNEHVKLLESQYMANKKLFEKGFLSKNGFEKSKAELALAESEAFELGSKNEQVVNGTLEHLSAINTQLALAQSEMFQSKAHIEDNRSKIREIEEQIKVINHELGLLKIVSPVNGTLMSVSIKSPGVNVTIGQQLLEIVPDSEHLTVEVKVPVEYADRVFKGMSVDIMFPSLAGSSTKQVKGILNYVSGDKVADQRSNQMFLEARVDLKDLADAKRLKLRVGLPAAVLFNTGKRSLMSYILRPLKDRVSMGLQ